MQSGWLDSLSLTSTAAQCTRCICKHIGKWKIYHRITRSLRKLTVYKCNKRVESSNLSPSFLRPLRHKQLFLLGFEGIYRRVGEFIAVIFRLVWDLGECHCRMWKVTFDPYVTNNYFSSDLGESTIAWMESSWSFSDRCEIWENATVECKSYIFCLGGDSMFASVGGCRLGRDARNHESGVN